MATLDGENDRAELLRQLHQTQDLLEIEQERLQQVQRELTASQIRCADALDAMASVKASLEFRLGQKGRSYLTKIKRSQ